MAQPLHPPEPPVVATRTVACFAAILVTVVTAVTWITAPEAEPTLRIMLTAAAVCWIWFIGERNRHATCELRDETSELRKETKAALGRAHLEGYMDGYVDGAGGAPFQHGPEA